MYSRDPRRFRRIVLFALAFAIAVLTPISALAQIDQGRILGTVTDANGAIVPGAAVLVKNERTGEERSTVTNESGYYIIASLKEVGRQRVSRFAFRVLPQRRARRRKLFRQHHRTESAVAAQPVWRFGWWSNHQRQVLLLFQLRRLSTPRRHQLDRSRAGFGEPVVRGSDWHRFDRLQRNKCLVVAGFPRAERVDHLYRFGHEPVRRRAAPGELKCQ
jgi:Carboxypeptidase regulatory-like domain